MLEAGNDGSQVIDDILAPAQVRKTHFEAIPTEEIKTLQAYFDGIASADSDFDWQYNTVAQTNLADREIFWPRSVVMPTDRPAESTLKCFLITAERYSVAALPSMVRH